MQVSRSDKQTHYSVNILFLSFKFGLNCYGVSRQMMHGKMRALLEQVDTLDHNNAMSKLLLLANKN